MSNFGSPRKKRKINKAKTYCICRKQDDGKGMVQCCVCMEWLHYACIGIKAAPNMRVFLGDFECPVCAQNKKRNFVQNAENINDLGFILRCIPLQNVKNFILDQIDDDAIDVSLSFAKEHKSLINTLSDDITEWNKICDQLDCDQFQQKYERIKEQIKCDEKEKALVYEINVMEQQKQKLINRIDCAYKSDKEQILNRYDKKISVLRKLSRHECNGCGDKGYDRCFVECVVCGKELCKECMLKCEHCGTDGGSDEFYCCDECDGRKECEGCFGLMCKYCFEKKKCDFCDKKVCEECIEWFERDENEHWACKVCHKKQELQMIEEKCVFSE